MTNPPDHTELLRAAGLLDVPDFPQTRTPPEGMCDEHARIWRAWWDYARSYRADKPRDFGGQHIMDSRTSHAQRRADWLRKGLEQLRGTEIACRYGISPQCGPAQDVRR
jgi:hypothetical protein